MTAVKICFVGLDNYPVLNPAHGQAYFGGESVQQTLLARAFAELGFQVSMVVKDHGQTQGEQQGDVRVWKTFEERAGIPVLRFLHPRMTAILRALEHADADVYYQSCAGMLTGVVAWFCRRKGRRFVFRLAHDTDCIPGEQLIRLWRDRKIYEYGLRRADAISAQGERQVALLEQHYGLDSTVVNMAVELPDQAELRRTAERDIDVLWVNNLRPFKRPELVAELARALPSRRFVMIGGAVPGYEQLYRRVEAQAAELPNLEFAGAVPYARVNAYFLRARTFLNTSDSEGFPNSFLQAWVRAVPVVSFFDPDGLIRRHGLGGVPENLGAMRELLAGMLGSAERLDEAGARCRRYALERYSPAAVAREYVHKGLIELPP